MRRAARSAAASRRGARRRRRARRRPPARGAPRFAARRLACGDRPAIARRASGRRRSASRKRRLLEERRARRDRRVDDDAAEPSRKRARAPSRRCRAARQSAAGAAPRANISVPATAAGARAGGHRRSPRRCTASPRPRARRRPRDSARRRRATSRARHTASPCHFERRVSGESACGPGERRRRLLVRGDSYIECVARRWLSGRLQLQGAVPVRRARTRFSYSRRCASYLGTRRLMVYEARDPKPPQNAAAIIAHGGALLSLALAVLLEAALCSCRRLRRCPQRVLRGGVLWPGVKYAPLGLVAGLGGEPSVYNSDARSREGCIKWRCYSAIALRAQPR